MERGTGATVAPREGLAAVRQELREQLRAKIDAGGLTDAPPTERRLVVREEALDLLRRRGAILPQRDLARIVNEVSDEVVGFGSIEFLLKDPSVTEVAVSGLADRFLSTAKVRTHVVTAAACASDVVRNRLLGRVCDQGVVSRRAAARLSL